MIYSELSSPLQFPPCTGNCILVNYIREDLVASKDREEKLLRKVAELEAANKAMKISGEINIPIIML